MPHDQQAIQQTKRNRWDDEQIHRRDAVGMIVEKCFPTLGRRPCTPNHILGHAGLPDFDTELEQLSMDPWSFPERIGDAHLRGSAFVFRAAPWNGHHGVSTSSTNTTDRKSVV